MSSFKSVLQGDRNVLTVSEFIEDRLYFVTLRYKGRRNTREIHYFSIDEELVYRNFYGDFGPLNIAAVYKYNQLLTFKLWSSELQNKKIVHYTITGNEKNRANAAFLIGTFAIFYLDMPPKEVYKRLLNSKMNFLPFQDATPASAPHYLIHMMDCFSAFKKATSYGFVDLNDFSLEEFEKYDSMSNGDMSWIIPKTLLAFSGPCDNPPGRSYHTPAFYVKIFKRLGIKTVIRLNIRAYAAETFTKAGISHHDLFFPDGTCPPEDILMQFLEICESTPYPVAVHCKAGLGRTGCLIGAYIIKHFHFTALEAIAWMRICRPGCVIGSQQLWLQEVERAMVSLGDRHRLLHHGDRQQMMFCQFGIYSKRQLELLGEETIVSKMGTVQEFAKPSPSRKPNLFKLAPLEGSTSAMNEHAFTQGDRLNMIKRKKKLPLKKLPKVSNKMRK